MKKAAFFIGIIIACTGFSEYRYKALSVDEHDTADYTLVKKSNGIELYEKWDSIDSETYAREVKAVFTVDTDLKSAAQLLQDQTKGKRWNKASSAYKILKEDDHWVSYIQYDLPWPVRNQDCVLRNTENYVGDSVLTIEFKSVIHSSFPARTNVERIDKVIGKWIFTKTPAGTQVEYFITTTPSKILPAWVTDPIIRNNLLNTLIEFRAILDKRNHEAVKVY